MILCSENSLLFAFNHRLSPESKSVGIARWLIKYLTENKENRIHDKVFMVRSRMLALHNFQQWGLWV